MRARSFLLPAILVVGAVGLAVGLTLRRDAPTSTTAAAVGERCARARTRAATVLYHLRSPETESTGIAVALEMAEWLPLCPDGERHRRAILDAGRDVAELRRVLRSIFHLAEQAGAIPP